MKAKTTHPREKSARYKQAIFRGGKAKLLKAYINKKTLSLPAGYALLKVQKDRERDPCSQNQKASVVRICEGSTPFGRGRDGAKVLW